MRASPPLKTLGYAACGTTLGYFGSGILFFAVCSLGHNTMEEIFSAWSMIAFAFSYGTFGILISLPNGSQTERSRLQQGK